MPRSSPTTPDTVDRFLAQWAEVEPDLDVSPMGIVGRISRLSRLLDRELAENFARHGIESWTFDVLATLKRAGPPHAVAAGDLVANTMVTTGAITNRIDRLVERGLVVRAADPDDRRKVLVQLTPAGLALVDEVSVTHMATERRILASLTERQQGDLAQTLRTLLVQLGDV